MSFFVDFVTVNILRSVRNPDIAYARLRTGRDCFNRFNCKTTTISIMIDVWGCPSQRLLPNALPDCEENVELGTFGIVIG